MGKKKIVSAKADADKILSEQIEQRDLRELLASARSKGFTKLTTAEKSAVRKQEESTFLRVLSSCTKTLTLWVLGTSSQTILSVKRKRGFPWPDGNRDRVNLVEVVRFLWRYYLDNRDLQADGLTEDGEFLAGGSKALEVELLRERLLERQIGNQEKQIKLWQLEEAHIPVAEVQIILAEAAGIITKKRETLERKLDVPARSQVSQAFEDMAEDLDRKGQSLTDVGEGEELERTAS